MYIKQMHDSGVETLTSTTVAPETAVCGECQAWAYPQCHTVFNVVTSAQVSNRCTPKYLFV